MGTEINFIPDKSPSFDSIKGPKRPPCAYKTLTVCYDLIDVPQNLFSDKIETITAMQFDKGYFWPTNRDGYDLILQRIFEALTGNEINMCLTFDIIPVPDYSDYIKSRFGGADRFSKLFGFDAFEIQGLNIDGTWAFIIDEPDFAFLADAFHELGHRVFPKSKDCYNSELGANVFMFCCLEKLSTELRILGIKAPSIDFGEQIDEDHRTSLEDAREIVFKRKKYLHKVE